MRTIDRVLRPFRERTDREIAQRQLDDARRLLLQHQSQTEYHAQMCAYHEKLVKRLSAYLSGEAR